jgi:hypothetical protein
MSMVTKRKQLVSTDARPGNSCVLKVCRVIVKYRTMVWWKAAALMLAETVSLGVSLLRHNSHNHAIV